MHDDEAWQAFSERISFEDSLHVDCLSTQWPLSPSEVNRLTENNLSALAAIAALEERRSEGADEDNPLMQELLRLDAKLTALVDIVNRLLTPADVLPRQRLVRFNARGAVIPSNLVPAGEGMLLSLRLDHCRSLALELPARVEAEFDDGSTFVSFAALNDTLCDAIERLVFRHHRRKVAGARQLPG